MSVAPLRLTVGEPLVTLTQGPTATLFKIAFVTFNLEEPLIEIKPPLCLGDVKAKYSEPYAIYSKIPLPTESFIERLSLKLK